MRTGHGGSLRAGAAYFALVFGTGFLMGMVRVPLLVPRLGERWSELLEMPLMAVAIVCWARFVVRRFGVPPRPGPRWAVGLVALALLLSAETMLGLVLLGRSPGELVAGRDPVSGSAYLLMLGVFAAMPRWLARTRGEG